ncbi:MAG: hypothetical protein ABW127_13550, partial [Candidatus Thiodiazotropha endolucinida]
KRATARFVDNCGISCELSEGFVMVSYGFVRVSYGFVRVSYGFVRNLSNNHLNLIPNPALKNKIKNKIKNYWW